MDDDEEELAALRQQRKNRMGNEAGATRGELARLTKQAMPDTSSLLDDAEGESDLRQMFPMSFGKQEPKHAPRGQLHQSTQRSQAGIHVLEPEAASSQASVDPPRSHLAIPTNGAVPALPEVADARIGPPRPPAPQPSNATAACASEPASIGPPRPPNLSPPQQATTTPIGPPRPSPAETPTSSSSDHLIGPPRPPRLSAAGSQPAAAAISTDAAPKDANKTESATIGPPRPPGLVGSPKPHASAPSVGPPRPPGLVGPPKPHTPAPSVGPPHRPPPPLFSEGPPVQRDPPDATVASPASKDVTSPATADPQRLPVTNEVLLQGHYKMVSAIDVDRSGSRVVTGGMDYNVCIYDFNGMKSDCKPFRELMPQDGHPVTAVSYSPSGDAFICVTGEPRAKVYSRDGHEKGEFKRGDMYLRDLRNTKGHVSGCTHGQWHPTERNTAMTSSTDGTVRVWDCEAIEQKMVIKPTVTGAGRVPVTACCYNDDGTLIAAALTNGSIQLWSVTGNFGRSAALGHVPLPKPQQALFGKQTWKYASGSKQHLRNAHPSGTSVTDLKVLRNGHFMLSRADDDTLKLWDIRKLKEVVHVWHQPLSHSQSRMCVSPQQDMVLIGVSPPERGPGGLVLAFNLQPPYDLVSQVGMPGPVTSLCWHPLINQILVGTGERSKGWTTVLYSPDMSEKGALMCATRHPRKKDPNDFEPPIAIHTPGALPMYRDDSWRKRRREPDGGDRKAQHPDPGPTVSGAGGGGKIGATNNTLLTQYLLEKGGMKRLEEQMDPRESFLRHKNADAELSEWTKAYKKTQPNKQFAEPDEPAGKK